MYMSSQMRRKVTKFLHLNQIKSLKTTLCAQNAAFVQKPKCDCFLGC